MSLHPSIQEMIDRVLLLDREAHTIVKLEAHPSLMEKLMSSVSAAMEGGTNFKGQLYKLELRVDDSQPKYHGKITYANGKTGTMFYFAAKDCLLMVQDFEDVLPRIDVHVDPSVPESSIYAIDYRRSPLSGPIARIVNIQV